MCTKWSQQHSQDLQKKTIKSGFYIASLYTLAIYLFKFKFETRIIDSSRMNNAQLLWDGEPIRLL